MDHPLTEFRKNRALTKAELAGFLGLSRASITRYEDGTRLVDRALVQEISKKTGIPPHKLRPDLAELFADRREVLPDEEAADVSSAS